MDTLEKIKQNCKCCITEKPLATSTHINMVQLNFRATWKYPVWGNILYKIPSEYAVAYVHDDAIGEDGKLVGPVRFAVEMDGDKIIYHEVPAERTCRVCGCTDSDCSKCIVRTGKSCYWVLPDVCSACVK